MRLILTGGGTGGHLYPGLAILKALRSRTGVEVLFIGTRRGIESRIVPHQGIPFKTVWISGLHRGRFLGNLLFPLKMAVSLLQAAWLTAAFNPDLVLGTGGYVSWPVLTAGNLLHKTTVLQEQNQKPGLVSRHLSSKVNRVYLSHESSLNYFKQCGHCAVYGNPVRRDLKKGSRTEAVPFFKLDPDKKTIFVFGGSQGALGLNRAVLKSLGRMMQDPKLQVLWAAGPRWKEHVSRESAAHAERIRVYAYIERMDLAFAAADLVVCRSGATTIAELTCLGLPAVLVPFPGAANNHQEENARELVDQGAAEMIHERDANPEVLTEKIRWILNDPIKRKAMVRAAGRMGRPDAADKIAEDLLNMVRYSKKEGIA